MSADPKTTSESVSGHRYDMGWMLFLYMLLMAVAIVALVFAVNNGTDRFCCLYGEKIGAGFMATSDATTALAVADETGTFAFSALASTGCVWTGSADGTAFTVNEDGYYTFQYQVNATQNGQTGAIQTFVALNDAPVFGSVAAFGPVLAAGGGAQINGYTPQPILLTKTDVISLRWAVSAGTFTLAPDTIVTDNGISVKLTARRLSSITNRCANPSTCCASPLSVCCN